MTSTTRTARLGLAALVVGLSTTLAACGSDDPVAAPAPATPPTAAPAPTPVATPPMSDKAAARFLAQATVGASHADIERVRDLGFDRWLADQFAKPRATSHWDWMVAQGYAVADNQNNLRGYDPSVWRALIASEDALRQRVAMALLEILVVGIDGLTGGWRQFAAAHYLDILSDNAFGDYRALLRAVSLSPAMGLYLTYLGNRKAAANGAVPDENYARELMQLFTLGTSQLEADGTVRPAETYGQADVSGLARVFTGFTYASADGTTPERLRQPMAVNAAQHEGGEKTFLGSTVLAGTDALTSLDRALDTVFAHPNVPPFVARQLIQRLVTSNPSPGYVGRVAAAFAGQGGSARGDMQATVRAILLDPEARDESAATAPGYGRVREPMLRLTGWARAFGATSPSGAWAIGDTSSSANRLAQSPGHSPSVFNFFRPGYSPPGTALAAQGMVAPELQITNEPSVVAYVNYMQALIANGAGDMTADYAAMLAKAGDSGALVDEVNLLLAAGGIGATALATIRAAVDSIAPAAANGPLNRVRTAILLAMASPDYLVQR